MFGIGTLSVSQANCHREHRPFQLFDQQLTTTSTWDDFTFAMIIRAGSEHIKRSPAMRVGGLSVTVQGCIAEAYIGIQSKLGDEYDAENLVKVTFDGKDGLTQEDMPGKTSDVVRFEWNWMDNLVFSAYSGLGNKLVRTKTGVPFADCYIKSGNEARLLNKSGINTVMRNNLFCLKEINLCH